MNSQLNRQYRKEFDALKWILSHSKPQADQSLIFSGRVDYPMIDKLSRLMTIEGYFETLKSGKPGLLMTWSKEGFDHTVRLQISGNMEEGFNVTSKWDKVASVLGVAA